MSAQRARAGATRLDVEIRPVAPRIDPGSMLSPAREASRGSGQSLVADAPGASLVRVTAAGTERGWVNPVDLRAGHELPRGPKRRDQVTQHVALPGPVTSFGVASASARPCRTPPHVKGTTACHPPS